MILDVFKEIFEKYPLERTKPKNESDFPHKMSFVYANDLKNFLFSIVGENDKYIVNISSGKDDEWLQNPYASIINIDSSNNIKMGLILNYVFNMDDKKLYFNLTQGQEFPKDNKETIATELYGCLNEIPHGFHQESIYVLSKVYDLNSISLDEFKEDLANLIKIYEFLIPKYRILLNKYSISLSDDFKEIFNQYGLEMKNKFKGNDFASRMRFNFNFNFYNILMEYVNVPYIFKSKFNVGKTDWINSPEVLFGCVEISDFNSDEGLFIYSKFDVYNQINEIGFLLRPGDKYTFSTDFINYFFSSVEVRFPNAQIRDNLTICLKKIKESNLNEDNLRHTFKDVVNLYNQLIVYYLGINLVDEKLNLKYDVVKKHLTNLKIDDTILKRTCASLNAGKNIIINGTPGTGKSEVAILFSKVAEKNQFIDGYILTTATSDWSTFDTIGGLMPDKHGNLIFHEGKFLEAIRLNKWLIIDEINRSDIDKAFGQLFTSLSHQDVELPYEYNGNPIKIKSWDENFSQFNEENATYFIGKNWRIIGTMNVDDKDSLFDLSYAFMRRFMFIEIDLPEYNDFKQIIEDNSKALDYEITDKLINLLEINKTRKLGPAIFIDMIMYIEERLNVKEDSIDDVLTEAVESYIIPQLEGLDNNNLKEIKNILDKQGIKLSEKIENLIVDY